MVQALYLVEHRLLVVVDKLVEQMDVKHFLVFLFDIVEQKVGVVVQDWTERVELVVAVGLAVVER
jgi:hypothetical protein